MILKVVSLYDKKLGVYANPTYVHNDDEEALKEAYRRMCAGEVPANVFDYDVYVLGTYDDKLGQFILNDKPEFLVSLGDYRYLQEKSNVQG